MQTTGKIGQKRPVNNRKMTKARKTTRHYEPVEFGTCGNSTYVKKWELRVTS